jgi:hypothetical protein
VEEKRRHCAKLMLCASRRRNNTLAMSTTEELDWSGALYGSRHHPMPHSHAPSIFASPSFSRPTCHVKPLLFGLACNFKSLIYVSVLNSWKTRYRDTPGTLLNPITLVMRNYLLENCRPRTVRTDRGLHILASPRARPSSEHDILLLRPTSSGCSGIFRVSSCAVWSAVALLPHVSNRTFRCG